MRSSNVTATDCFGKTVTPAQLTACVLLKVVNIPQYKTHTHTKLQSAIIILNVCTVNVLYYWGCLCV
jgi:hypothetical protein